MTHLTPTHPTGSRRDQMGAVLVASVLVIAVCATFATVMVSTIQSGHSEIRQSQAGLQRLYLAETSIFAAIQDLKAGGTGNIGSATAPVTTPTGSHWAETTSTGVGTYSVLARGLYDGKARTIRAVVRETGHVFHHAIFAGNSSGDSQYELLFEGVGTQADSVVGDVYSGGSMRIQDDATIVGTPRAAGSISGGSGESGITQPPLDLASMAYETHHDVDVAGEFLAHESWSSAAAGGSAWQVPQSSEAHIFRKNPSDRTSNTASTTKDDYFLEDPYEPVGIDAAQDGTDPYDCSLTVAQDRVFFIDGNLWLHNLDAFSLRLVGSGGEPVRVTFVVKGNIYISDNLFYKNAVTDGVALIAVKDSAESDSGNIYFGDPLFGTLQYMSAFMYAENNFFDSNLSAAGSQNVRLVGSMSAGNQVDITRTFSGYHSRLEVSLDDRLKQGTLTLPGIPSATHRQRYEIVAWMEVSAP